jgi:D-alanyl-D-alanine carboxypeptidase
MRYIASVFISILVSLCLLMLFNRANGQGANRTREINAVLDRLVAENGIPAIGVSFIYPDGNQYSYTAGFSDVESQTKLSTSSVMFSGSIGKTYAVAILMQLVDEGKVILKRKFIEYFPNSFWLQRIPNIDDITVEMLLMHRTGLPRYEMKPEVWEALAANPDKVWSYEDRISIIFNDKPIHEAGKGWSYSDTNYILLGMLIEEVTGGDYYDELKKRILVPEKLFDTHPAVSRKIKDLAVGYSRLPETFRMPEKVVVNGEYAFNPQMEWTGGGIVSTTADLARWAKIFYEGKLFSDSLLKKIVTPCKHGINVMPNRSYGMGSFLFDTNRGKVYGHTGFVPGFNSIFAYDPDSRVAIALQFNCDYATSRISLIEYLNKVMEVILF